MTGLLVGDRTRAPKACRPGPARRHRCGGRVCALQLRARAPPAGRRRLPRPAASLRTRSSRAASCGDSTVIAKLTLEHPLDAVAVHHASRPGGDLHDLRGPAGGIGGRVRVDRAQGGLAGLDVPQQADRVDRSACAASLRCPGRPPPPGCRCRSRRTACVSSRGTGIQQRQGGGARRCRSQSRRRRRRGPSPGGSRRTAAAADVRVVGQLAEIFGARGGRCSPGRSRTPRVPSIRLPARASEPP